MRVVLASLLLVVLATTGSRADDQTILGHKLVVKNPSSADKRKLTGSAKEIDVADKVIGDPSANGAELTITLDGGTPGTQSWSLPATTNPATGKPFWSGDAVHGFKYGDPKGVNGPVKKVQIKSSSKGVFQVAVQVDGKLGQIDLLPPNPGTGACVLLAINAGDSYSVRFADGAITNKGALQFSVTKPTSEGSCVPPSTTTTMIGGPTTTLASPCPGGQTLCGATCVDTASDAANCGSCGHDCNAGAVNATFTCQASGCAFAGCDPGYWDLDANQTCEYACTFTSAQESCNGVDDNCNGQIDENIPSPTPAQVCGVSPSATTPECTTGVSVACSGGTWQCTFPAGVCTSGCASTAEVCDGLDNNCNGSVDETTPSVGLPCASDDSKPPPGDGACRTTGTYVCSGPNSVACSAVKADCSTLPGGCTELPDGIDNDCDGLVDETFNSKGSNATYFVKPAVTHVAAGVWMYSYEASRVSATSTSPGRGNGWSTSAPAGSTIDGTLPSSVSDRRPWFDATGAEAEQACAAVGGYLCATSDYQTACQATAACTWGFSPRGSACTTQATASKYCNLASTYDTDPASTGDQDALLSTASPVLQSCWADWSSLQGNATQDSKIFDITGNLRELTKTAANSYTLMGGSFLSQLSAGATCSFTTFAVNQNFAYRDAGFRCCFSADPRL